MTGARAGNLNVWARPTWAAAAMQDTWFRDRIRVHAKAILKMLDGEVRGEQNEAGGRLRGFGDHMRGPSGLRVLDHEPSQAGEELVLDSKALQLAATSGAKAHQLRVLVVDVHRPRPRRQLGQLRQLLAR